MAGVTEDAADVLRLARAGVLAAVCVVTTALGHALMSGDLLPWWAVGLAFAVTVPGAWWLTGRERGAATVVGATVGAQGLLHLLFSLAHLLIRPPDATTGGPGTEQASGMHHGAVFTHSGVAVHHHGARSGVVETASGTPLLSAVMHGSTAGMLLTHLLAAVVCGLWLWRGEAAVHRIGRALEALLFAPLRRVCGVLFHPGDGREARPYRAAAGDWERPQPTPVSLRHVLVRRGPPRSRSAVSRPSPDPLLAVRP
ncbi:hypothetical protein [Streptomyces sp. NBRC 110035]|uniref:hypothetical protein n=1 Tax=Streptomyces sp. NBRC 110035 TaxID=1547867 RepID=UPI0005A87568|nr:hypothetical protein [Streptomyces sp. NBRC 110035]